MFPRAMNNQEKSRLAEIKELGFAYELKFDYSPRSGGYIANIPALRQTWCLNSKVNKSK